MLSLKARKPAEGLTNPFKLPRGDRLRKALVGVFREQRNAIMGWIKAEVKDGLSGILSAGLRDWPVRGRAVPDGLPDRVARQGAIPEAVKDQGPPPIPLAFPGWDEFGLGALKVSERMTPLLRQTWEAAADRFAPRVGLDPDAWSVVNPHTEAMIEQAALAFCQSTNDTTSRDLGQALADLRDELRRGIVEHGEAHDKLTERVRSIFDGAETWRARRIATTETSRAVHAAQEQAAIHSGVVTGWRWLLSSDACPTCVAIAARCPAARLGQPFAAIGNDPTYSQVKFPPAHPHCCLPETPVVAPIRIAGIKAHYDGPVVRIRLSDGSDVTVTPHHMLLTPQGFATASSFVEGDDVLRYGIGEPVAGGDPDDNRVPIPIGQVFDSFAKSASVATACVPVAPEYLHGDAALCQGYINVVSPHRFLMDAVHAERFEPFLDGSLRWADLDRSLLAGDGDLTETLFALRDATDGGVGGLRESKARLRAQATVAEQLGGGQAPNLGARFEQAAADRRARDPECGGQGQLALAESVSSGQFHAVDCDPSLSGGINAPAYLNPHPFEASPDGVAADSERIGDCLGRFPGKVSACHVVSVEHLHYVGPVYDLTTGTSLYLIGNGIVSSNCMCSMVEVLDTDEQPAWGDTLHDPDPATDDEAGSVMADVAGRDAAILAGSSKRKRPVPAKRPAPLSRKGIVA